MYKCLSFRSAFTLNSYGYLNDPRLQYLQVLSPTDWWISTLEYVWDTPFREICSIVMTNKLILQLWTCESYIISWKVKVTLDERKVLVKKKSKQKSTRAFTFVIDVHHRSKQNKHSSLIFLAMIMMNIPKENFWKD